MRPWTVRMSSYGSKLSDTIDHSFDLIRGREKDTAAAVISRLSTLSFDTGLWNVTWKYISNWHVPEYFFMDGRLAECEYPRCNEWWVAISWAWEDKSIWASKESVLDLGVLHGHHSKWFEKKSRTEHRMRPDQSLGPSRSQSDDQCRSSPETAEKQVPPAVSPVPCSQLVLVGQSPEALA